jgi:lipid-A-disaccharide synthase
MMKSSDNLKLYIIAGEASGDLHGSNLMKALLNEKKELDFRFWGGDQMADVGGKLVKHIRELAFMGFWEVFKNIRTIFKNIDYCKKDIEAFKPDALILIDYPGFNLRIAEWAKTKGIKVYYYVSPQVWAWKQSRVHKIKRVVDHMYVILPFEKAFYKQFDFEVEYVGHPLLDAIEKFKSNQVSTEVFLTENNLTQKPIIAILPGSRKQEVKKKLPVMLEAVKAMSDYQVVIAGSTNLDESFYMQLIGKYPVKILYGKTYDILSTSEAAVVTSGTATLETALFDVPEVVCYKSSQLSYMIAKRLIKIKFISLVNLIADKEIVKELIQQECNPKEIKKALIPLLLGGDGRQGMLGEYEKLKEQLGGGGASMKIAQSLLKTIQ